MKIRYHRETRHFLSIDNIHFEIPYNAPIVERTIVEKTPTGYVLGLLYNDTDYNPTQMFTDEDGNGKILSFHRHAGAAMHEEACRAMGRYANEEDPDDRIPAAPIFRLLSCYSHSGEQWGLIGEVHQDQWDTARIAGVWVPDKCAEENIEMLTKGMSEDERKLRIDEYVRSIISTFNSYLSGDVYGISICTYEIADNTKLPIETQLTNEEACWNFVGAKYALEEMRTLVNNAVKNVS